MPAAFCQSSTVALENCFHLPWRSAHRTAERCQAVLLARFGAKKVEDVKERTKEFILNLENEPKDKD